MLAAYGPFYYGKDRRTAFAAVGIMTLVAARVWDPSAAVITIAVLRTAVGPLLALYFSARHEMLQALRDRAERAEHERCLLAEQARGCWRTTRGSCAVSPLSLSAPGTRPAAPIHPPGVMSLRAGRGAIVR